MEQKIAYVSSEIGLNPNIWTYSGGLGVLAGDSLKSAADLGMPVVGFTLLYHNGYFKQHLSDGWQVEEYPRWDPETIGMRRLPETIKVHIEDRDVAVGAWQYDLRGGGGSCVPVYFLDTDLEQNAPWDRDITRKPLYTGEEYFRLAQQTVLGVGTVRMLQALGEDISTYHLNEGHAALLSLELLAQQGNLDAVREQVVFTTHTPVPEGLQKFSHGLASQVAWHYFPGSLERLAGPSAFDMTLLALNTSRYANGVSRKHGEVSRAMFPDFAIGHITNGVHSETWTSPAHAAVYDERAPGWRENPWALTELTYEDERALASAHRDAKERLVEYVAEKTGVRLDANRPILGFARRMTPYKQADLPFQDLEGLAEVARRHGLQFVYSGKAHPSDGRGKEIIHTVYAGLAELNRMGIPAAYIPNYNIKTAQMMTAGSSAWLNTPEIPKEASGTSGMCAAHNGVPHISTLDGWWLEGWQEGRTGWAVGGTDAWSSRDPRNIYAALDAAAPHLEDPSVMRAVIAHNAAQFSTHRMMIQYAKDAYNMNGTTPQLKRVA